jgi:hypothetical protein
MFNKAKAGMSTVATANLVIAMTVALRRAVE